MIKRKQSLSKPYRLIGLIGLIPLGLLLVLATVGTITSTPDFIRGYQIRSHDKTVVAEVEAKTSNAAKYANKGTRNSEKKYDTARVTYTVNDQTYTSLHTVYTPKVGETLILFYDPSRPQDSVSEIEVQFAKNYWMKVAIISGVGLPLAFGLIYMKLKSRHSLRNKNSVSKITKK